MYVDTLARSNLLVKGQRSWKRFFLRKGLCGKGYDGLFYFRRMTGPFFTTPSQKHRS
jgi:hypothetical protein